MPYQIEGRTFEEVRTTFERQTGNPKITVPAIQDGERWIFESFVLAQFVSPPRTFCHNAHAQLEEKYATSERTLFPSEAFARFINTWADKDLGSEIIPLFAPWVSTCPLSPPLLLSS